MRLLWHFGKKVAGLVLGIVMLWVVRNYLLMLLLLVYLALSGFHISPQIANKVSDCRGSFLFSDLPA
jgi:hypothetical protein